MDNEAINSLMQGLVTEVTGSRARVSFPDRDNMVSAPLQVIQLFTGVNKAIHMPSIGEEVVCMFMSTGLEDGYIIGSVYVDDNNPPANNNAILFEDGSSIAFSGGALNINMVQSVNITAPQTIINGDVAINGSLSTSGSIKATGDVVGGGKSLMNHTNGGQGVD